MRELYLLIDVVQNIYMYIYIPLKLLTERGHISTAILCQTGFFLWCNLLEVLKLPRGDFTCHLYNHDDSHRRCVYVYAFNGTAVWLKPPVGCGELSSTPDGSYIKVKAEVEVGACGAGGGA